MDKAPGVAVTVSVSCPSLLRVRCYKGLLGHVKKSYLGTSRLFLVIPEINHDARAGQGIAWVLIRRSSTLG
jgi:hypothetical protein